MKNPFLLGLLALLLVPPSLASAQSDDAEAAYERKDVAALTRMANAGDPVAQRNLGEMYRYGEGVPKDDAAAFSWYHKAADQGVAQAQNNLGIMYVDGTGVTQDYTIAVSWFRKAADQGEANAQNNLGLRYQYGEGVAQDYVQAYKWFNLSAASRNENAKTYRDNIAAEMTSAQIAEAQRLSGAWVKK